MTDPSAASLLTCDTVSVHFGGLQALVDVSLDVPRGSITGLIGPNGAGKTTLFNVINGLQRADAGTVVFDGADISDEAPYRRARRGIARTFQRLEVFRRLSVHDNLLVAWETQFNRAGWLGRVFADNPPPSVGRERVAEVIELLGLGEVAGIAAAALSTGTNRVVELGRALCTNPRLVLLDEPASGLDRQETDLLRQLLLAVTADREVTVLLVEHDVDLVMETCERIHVLEFGRIVARGTPLEVRNNEAVRAAYLGEPSAADA